MSDPVIDLDAARAARLEASGGPIPVRFGGEDFSFPPELPYEAIVALSVQEDVDRFFELTIGTDDGKRFMSHSPSLQDIQELSRQLSRSKGFADMGESSASNGSAKSNGNRSRRTSSASTASTSRKRSTAQSASPVAG